MDEIDALNYTTDDWIRVCNENILWAEARFDRATEPMNRIAYRHLINGYYHILREIDSGNPYNLADRIKDVQRQNRQLRDDVKGLTKVVAEMRATKLKKKSKYD